MNSGTRSLVLSGWALIALAGPATAETITFGDPDGILSHVVIDKTTLCVGETVKLTVHAHPGIEAETFVDGWPGRRHYLQFHRPDPERLVRVTADTTDLQRRHVEHITVEVAECAQPDRYIRLWPMRDPYHRYTVDFRATVHPEEPDSPLKGARRYHWSFGDGESEYTTVPYVSHDYSDSVDHPERYTHFIATVTSGDTLETRRAIAIPSSFAGSLAMGYVQAEVRVASAKPVPDGALEVAVEVRNHHSEPITFDRYLKQYHPCDTSVPPRWAHVSAVDVLGDAVLPEIAHYGYPKSYAPNSPSPSAPGELTVAPGGKKTGRLPGLPVAKGICVVGFSLLGATPSGLPVYGNYWVEVRRNALRAELEENYELLALFADLEQKNLLVDPDLVTTEDLYRLEQEGHIVNTPEGWKAVKP